MKRSNLIALLLFLLSLTMLPSGAAGQGVKVVVLDAAHGGRDAGVLSADGTAEKDLNLALALLVQRELQGTPGLRVVLTRTGDTDLSVEERVKRITAAGAAAVVSIHANGGFYKEARGYEVYFSGLRAPGQGRDESSAIIGDMTKTKHLNDSVRLAQGLQRNLEKVFPKEGRGLREAPVPLLTSLTVPAVVVEVGFVTNTKDRNKLKNEASRLEVARALARGIKEGLAER